MKARIYISTIVLAVGMVMAWAQETKTNTPAGATTSVPGAGEVAVPPPAAPPAAAPAAVSEAKPPAAAPAAPTNAVPAQPHITATPRATPKTVAPASMTATSAPAPAVVKEEKPPVVVPPGETNAVPAQPEVTAGPVTPANPAVSKPASSGTGHKGLLAGGVVVLVVCLGVLMWWRSHIASQGSLITSALNEDQKSREDNNAPPPMS